MNSSSECNLYKKQDFLICTTIHKAQHLAKCNVDSYVLVRIGKKSKRTRTFQNSENPYYNEYFTFHFFCTLPELLHYTILYQVKQSIWFKDIVLGELFIDMNTLWNQSLHTFFKKWGKLENPMGKPADTDILRGYLQIDLSIVSHHDGTPQPVNLQIQNYDDIEKNLLNRGNTSSQNIKNIKYYIKIFYGIFIKKSDYLVQVSFAGMNVKSIVIKSTSTPQWNQEFSVNWFYPSLSQTILIQIMTTELLQWKTIANYEINFNNISFSKETPTLGPTYLQLYDSSNPSNYIGRILIEIKSKIFNKEIALRTFTQMLTPPIMENDWWNFENFMIEFLVWRGDCIHNNLSNMKISMKYAEFVSNKVECFLKPYENNRNLKYFIQETPCKSIHMIFNFPDCRLKYEIDYFISCFINFMKIQLESFKIYQLKYIDNIPHQAKCLREITNMFMLKLQKGKTMLTYHGDKKLTDLDINRNKYLENYFEIQIKDFENCRTNTKIIDSKNIEKTYKDYDAKIKEFENLLSSKIHDTWPELILTITLASKDVAICKVNVNDFLYCKRKQCKGRLCGMKNQFIFKPLSCKHSCYNCGCIFGKLDGWLWIGTKTERNNYEFSNIFEIKEKFYYNITVNTLVNCNIYIHQGKIQPGADKTVLSDPKVLLTFFDSSVFTTTLKQTLSPIWNEIIKFQNFSLPGNYEWYIKNPPLISIEVFDEDRRSINEYLGFSFIQASVSDPYLLHYNNQCDSKILNKLNKIKHTFPPILKWLTIHLNGELTAELLISCELIKVENVTSGDLIKQVKIEKDIPQEICPVNKKYKIEVIFAGIRNFLKPSFETTAGKFKIKIHFGNFSLQSGPSGSKLNNSINFLDLYSAGIVELPYQLEYWPPIMLTLILCKNSKDTEEVIMGAALIPNATKYLFKEKTKFIKNFNASDTMISLGTESDFTERTSLLTNNGNKRFNLNLLLKKFWYLVLKEIQLRKLPAGKTASENNYNWWTKFYYSLHKGSVGFHDITKKHELVIYTSELEKQSEFSFFQDWAEPIHLIPKVHKKSNTISENDESYCTLKYKIIIKSCDSVLLSARQSSISVKSIKNDFNNKFQQLTALMSEISVTIRIYMVQALNLTAHDARSASDAFIKIEIGNKKINDRSNYVRNNSNPIFGKCFQLQTIIPRDHMLYISLYDRGISDSLIGTTIIDLEDRVRSKHRATVGIAKEYSSTGYNIWHDICPPSYILKEICRIHNLDQPIINGSTIEVGGIIFFDSSSELSKDDDLEERLSLSVLKEIEKIPQIGYKLVPEHVETRSLYRKDYPGVEQGKLQLWIEIYETDIIPYPIEITPNSLIQYELRVIIYNTSDVILDERNIFATKMNDIYVKGWVEDNEVSQKTDTHYRSLNGEGMFNWRMIFPFKYSINEDMMGIKVRSTFFGHPDINIKQPPVLHIQIWDDDMILKEDFIGSLNINLSNFLEPSQTKAECRENQKGRKYINLFNYKKIKGWFPCHGHHYNKMIGITGKIEMELELLNEIEANVNPVGLGRSPPKPLPEPFRPKTSFNPILHPLKSIQYILIPFLKKCLCCLVIIGIIILFFYLRMIFK